MCERKLPIGIQSFEDLRKNQYVYVDKTEYIWRLINKGKVYFLSRPRRFGKSLLISTIEAYFQGKQELFRGLAIEKYENGRGENAWQEYPVVRFSLSGGNYTDADGLRQRLSRILSNYEEKCGINPAGMDLPNRFSVLLERLYSKTGKQVVVLVDEYDKPLLETMSVEEEQEEANRRLYKGFFSILKDEDQYLKFIFFSGVTKFSKISVFSDLNQLRDISMSDDYAEICGITEKEMIHNFEPEITEMSEKLGMSRDVCLKELGRMYDGYHFSKNAAGVYNPFSLLNAFEDGDLRQYWFATATSTFVIHKLQNSKFTAEQFVTGVKATEASLMDYQEQNPDPIPLFYQAGYLTISGWDARFRVYDLKFPNAEVQYGFLNSLMDAIVPSDENRPGLFVMNFIEDLESGDVSSFMKRLYAIFASIPYVEFAGKSYENEWRNEIYLVLALLGMNVHCEVHTSKGRADCIVETAKYVYIFEFKLDKTSEEALKWIEDRGYADAYLAEPRKICKIGVNFSSEKRNIESWKSENQEGITKTE